jgi:transposase
LLGGAKQSTPEARRGALARGVEQQKRTPSNNGHALDACPHEGGRNRVRFGRVPLPSLLVSSCLVGGHSPILKRVQGGAPYRSYATLAASPYIRSGLSPYQNPACNIARGRDAMGPGDEGVAPSLLPNEPMERPMKRNDLSRSLIAFDQNSTLLSVVELSLKSWLVGGLVPGVNRQPLKKQKPEPHALLALLVRWRDEAIKAGREINRIVVAFEAGYDGFWLARWLRTRQIEAYVIHPTSIPVSREHRRAKTDRLDTALLMRAVLGWLRGEPKHCSMVAIPSLAEEDARRPNREREVLVRERTRVINRMKSTLIRFGIRNFNIKLRQAGDHLKELRGPESEPLPPNTLAELHRDMERLRVIRKQIKEIETARLQRLKRAPHDGTHPMICMLARIMGIGIETADMLVHEVLSRKLRDQRAVARYGGLTGAPDESGTKRREKGLARAGNARVRRGMIQLAWRWLMFQHSSDLTQWYQARTAGAKPGLRKTMIVALARKLLIALWRYVMSGEVPAGAVLRSA